jgi:prepilin-type N-terminal cleavage/methylation domain-containing protein
METDEMANRTDNEVLVGRADRPSGLGAFTLIEVLTALAILGLASSSVLVVINRCVASAANSALRMEAFELARENLERVLIADVLQETVEYGTSEIYPDLSWQTVIEAFPEPVGGQMWVRAVCSAEYKDSHGETQKVELVHWITALTDRQTGQLMENEDLELLEVEQLLVTAEEAAAYAGVDLATLQEWIERGLMTNQDGAFIKYNLDLFVESRGDPTQEEKAKQVESILELAMVLRTMQKELEEGAGEPGQTGDIEPTTGLTHEQLEEMNVGEVMDLLKQKQR